MAMSVWHTPAATTRTKTSFDLGSSKAQFFKGSGLFRRSGNSGSYFHFQGLSFWLAGVI
jgi:hypothetical protein